MNIDNKTDLILFINKEKKDPSKVNHKKVYIYFYKCLLKTITELDSKFKELAEIDACVLNGTKMFFHVFFSLITYSNNLKLTVFLSERALLLYSEFIIMSRDKKVMDDYFYKPNINDAISFAYKQTIGSFLISELKTNKKLICVRECSNILVEIYNKLYLKYKNDLDFFTIYIDTLNDTFNNNILYLFLKLGNDNENKNFILKKTFEIINFSKIETFDHTVLFLKVFIETLQNCSQNTLLKSNISNFYTVVYKNYICFKNPEIGENYDTKILYNYKKTKIYSLLKNLIKNNKK